MIEHANIIYMPNISPLGGIETWVRETVEMYKDYDIAVVSKFCDENQKKLINKYCKVYIHTNQKIKADVVFINYDQTIIPFINDEADIYQVIHADYTQPIYGESVRPKPHPRIKAFICITKFLATQMKDMLSPNNIIQMYNPLNIHKMGKPIVILSATRLHKHKGVERMRSLIKKLDEKNINYLWIIITGDLHIDFESPNVCLIKNRLNISRYLCIATYVALLSDSEADSYTLKEGLYRNIPVITTPLPYLDEIGVKDGVNGYILNFDCSNIDHIVENIDKVPVFKYRKQKNEYDKILSHKPSHYEKDRNEIVNVHCIKSYFDIEQNELKTPREDDPYENKENHPNRCYWKTKRERAEFLVSKGIVEIMKGG